MLKSFQQSVAHFINTAFAELRNKLKRITMTVDNEKAIRAIVKSSVKTFAGAFSEKHLSQLNDEDGISNETFIYILFPQGNVRSFSKKEFDSYGNELEHRTENIILNISEPQKSFVYETDYRGELVDKEYIQFNIQ